MKQKNACAYVRVSTETQTSENQRIQIENYAKQNGYSLAHFFEDDAVSGSIPPINRESFKNMIDFIKDNKMDAVFIYELSRLGRSFKETLDAVFEIEKYTPLFSISPKESWLSVVDPNIRKLMLSILSWVAERERELLIERTKAGIERARKEGKHIGRPKMKIDQTELLKQLAKKTDYIDIAKILGVSRVTLWRRLKETTKT